MSSTLFERLRSRFRRLPPLESLAALSEDLLVSEGIQQARRHLAEGVHTLREKKGEPGAPANPNIKAIGGFPILRELGRGGMGAVYLALNEKQQQVVIKVPFTEFGTTPQYVELFFREFEALATVRHENIVRVFRYGRDEGHGVYYYVAEFVDGITLKEWVDAWPEKVFTASEAATVSLGVLRALHFLHTRNVTHRDLKLGNIMFDREGSVKLIDFGAAKIAGQHSELTNSGVVLGTFDYMAPEAGHSNTEKKVGIERDLYALGILHYRLMKGRLPIAFGAGHDAAVAFARFADARGRPLKDVKGLDPLTTHLLHRLTERDPKKRLVDFDEIEARLAQIIKLSPVLKT